MVRIRLPNIRGLVSDALVDVSVCTTIAIAIGIVGVLINTNLAPCPQCELYSFTGRVIVVFSDWSVFWVFVIRDSWALIACNILVLLIFRLFCLKMVGGRDNHKSSIVQTLIIGLERLVICLFAASFVSAFFAYALVGFQLHDFVPFVAIGYWLYIFVVLLTSSFLSTLFRCAWG